jgi:hypothetical protein
VAEGGFASGHFALVCLVVFAGEVEEAVEDEDFYFVLRGVGKGFSLAGGGVERDGEVAGVFACEGLRRGEAKDVGWFVFAAEAAVELTDGLVGGEEDVDCSAKTDGGAGAVEEAREGRRGELGFEVGGFDGDHWIIGPGFDVGVVVWVAASGLREYTRT